MIFYIYIDCTIDSWSPCQKAGSVISSECRLSDFKNIYCRYVILIQFDLACNEWRRSLIGFSRTLGTFIALPLTGFVSDRWGRSTALALNSFNSAWVGLTRHWARSYASFMTLEILEAVFGAGVFSCSYILGRFTK